MFNNQKGFTLIELMVVVVIIGILAAIALPNFLAMQDRAKEAESKSNAHTVQLSVEDYKTQSNGNKPLSSASFATGITTANVSVGIPSNVKNPFIAGAANTGAGVVSAINASTTANSATLQGQVGYVTIAAQSSPYIIVGYGKVTTTAPVITLTEGQ
jgi:prepilin-type N-terminal cleavage/methylation domain-containing protein